MDYSDFRRSDNVEDNRQGRVGEILNLLTAPMQASWQDLTTHPWETPASFYGRQYATEQPPPSPFDYSQLGRQAGLSDIDNMVKLLGQK